MRIATIVACTFLAVGCVSGRGRLDPAAMAMGAATRAAERADALLLTGCYRCLLEARSTYASLADGPLAQRVQPRWFESAILVTLREKELSLPADESYRQAEQVAARLPAGFEARRILRLVAAVPPDAEGSGRLQTLAFRRALLPDARQLSSDLEWLVGSPLQPSVRTYLTLALACGEALGTFRNRALLEGDPGEAGLLVYRRNTCVSVRQAAALEALWSATPDFLEAAYFVARATAVGLSTGGDRTRFRTLLDAAVGAFPSSPAVTYLAGSGHQLLGSCRDALRYYDATIALQPRHENAWLGRTMCWTAMGETSAAISSATTLIGLGSDAHMMDAFYWRAFNHHRLKDLAAARTDIDESKRRGARPEIRTLAGIIEYEQGDLVEAQRDLDVAWGMSQRTCGAAWYLGLVHIRREAWVEAGGAFEAAMGCYLRNVTEAEAGLAALERRTDLDLAYRQQQSDGFRAAITEDRRQERAAAMNAATCFANAGVLAKIERLVSVASLEASLAPEIERLREYLKERAAASSKSP